MKLLIIILLLCTTAVYSQSEYTTVKSLSSEPQMQLPTVTGNGNKVLRVNAGGTAYELFTPSGGGDLLSTNNLSDLTNAGTARTNLGATTVGGNIFTLTNPGAVRFIRINADNTITSRTAAEMLSDLGAQGTGSYLVAGNNLSDVSNAGTARTNLGATTVGGNLFTLANPGAIRFLRVNADNTVSARTAAEQLGDITGWTEVVVSGSNATTTGQALVDITGLVSATLTNSTKYEIDVLLDVGTSAVTTGTQYAVQTGGSGGAGVVSVLMMGTTTTNATTQVTLSSPAAAQGTFLTTSSTSGTIAMRGFVTTRGSGTANISIQHLKVTSGTSTVRTGSRFRYRLAQ